VCHHPARQQSRWEGVEGMPEWIWVLVWVVALFAVLIVVLRVARRR
jgi:hypothetical protein